MGALSLARGTAALALAATLALAACRPAVEPGPAETAVGAGAPLPAPAEQPSAGGPAAPAATATPSTPALAPTPGPGTKPPEACTRTAPERWDVGTAKLGKFAGKRLPKGWVAAYENEAAVFRGIAYAYGRDWACFQAFYPEAAMVFKQAHGFE